MDYDETRLGQSWYMTCRTCFVHQRNIGQYRILVLQTTTTDTKNSTLGCIYHLRGHEKKVRAASHSSCEDVEVLLIIDLDRDSRRR